MGCLPIWCREVCAAVALIDIFKRHTAGDIALAVIAEYTHFSVFTILSAYDVDHLLWRKDIGRIAVVVPFMDGGIVGMQAFFCSDIALEFRRRRDLLQ